MGTRKVSREFPYRVVDRRAARDFTSYDGRGASKALLLAIDRASASPTCGSGRLYALHEMALCQIKREQAREGMVVA